MGLAQIQLGLAQLGAVQLGAAQLGVILVETVDFGSRSNRIKVGVPCLRSVTPTCSISVFAHVWKCRFTADRSDSLANGMDEKMSRLQ